MSKTPWRWKMLCALTFLGGPLLVAQGSAGSSSRFEPRTIVLMPTAGMLPKGSYALNVDFYQGGGVLLGLSAGIFDRFCFGVSYGGSSLLGYDKPEMNKFPGLFLKLRLVEESVGWPALALGFDSQGMNGYLKDLERYAVKSPGLYAVISKNYLLAGFFSLHGGVNYSFEHGDGDEDINVYVGAEKTLGPFLSLVAEYNLALNDNSQNAIGRGRGYLNFALRASLGGGVTVGFNLEDLLKNSRAADRINRTAHFELVARF